MALLVTIAGEGVSSFTAAILALTVPLVAAGVLFGWLTDTERLRGFGRALLYWAAAFAASRLSQQLLVGEGQVKDGLIGFVLYQAFVGLLFALGFLLLYQQVLAGFNKVLGEPAAPEADGGEGHG
jgi:predicted small integral membrane protein